MTYAFLDTNILLHYKVFEGMPWNEIIGDDDLIFVICQKVFDEIDKHKDGDKSKLRNRAKNINQYLISYLDEKPLSHLKVEFCPNPSKVSTESIGFDSSSSDEYIVYAAYEFDAKEDNKVIVTGDGGMKLRAKKVDLKTILINNPTYHIANEPTEEEKQIKQLKKELARYTSRCSKPVLLFEDETDTIVLKKYDISDFKVELNVFRSKLIEQYPRRYPEQQRKGRIINGLTISDLISSYSPYTEDDYNTYNHQIDEFIDAMVNHQKNKLTYSAIDECIKEVKLSIFNHGTAPTGKMGVTILLPNDLLILSEDALVEYDMTPPEPPQLLSSLDRSMIERAKINDLITANLVHAPYHSHDYRDKVIEEHWSPEPALPKEMFFDLPSLNHNLNLNILGAHRLFIPCTKSGEFVIQWAISDESNIDPLTGKLTIVIK